MRIDHAIGLPADRGADNIAYGDHRGAALFGLPHRRQRVSRLARLGDGDEQVARAHKGAPVPELGGDIHFHGNAGKLFDHILARQTRMPRRAAGHNEDLLHRQELVRGNADLFQVDRSRFLRDPSADRVHDGPGLLMDLFQHEMAVPALLGHYRVPHDLGDVPGDLIARQVGDAHAVPAQHGHFVVIQEQHVARAVQDGRDVRGKIVLAPPQSDHEGAAFAGAYDHVRAAAVDHGHGIGAFQPARCFPHRLFQGHALLRDAVDQVGDHFRVRLGRKGPALGDQFFFQDRIIFDDAVVHHHHRTGAVRMRVLLRRTAMGRPPHMAHAHDARERLPRQDRLEVLQFADGAPYLQAVALDQGDAGGVISPVLELLEALDQDGDRVFLADIADDAAHTSLRSIVRCKF